MSAPTPALVTRLTPVIFVDRVEPCLGFWTDRLGFTKVAEVPGPDGKPQFAMLVRDGVEVMYQTWAALEAELPAAAKAPRGHSVILFIEVSDIDQVDRALAGVPRLVDRHTTFYGMEEFSVREPGGAIVTFAMKTGK
ncbi:MAG TPA: VOC family protein [Gemmatimonadales bacterium]|nr:VOC family protein [Gemmatimonadales bacterium]